MEKSEKVDGTFEIHCKAAPDQDRDLWKFGRESIYGIHWTESGSNLKLLLSSFRMWPDFK